MPDKFINKNSSFYMGCRGEMGQSQPEANQTMLSKMQNIQCITDRFHRGIGTNNSSS